MPKSLREAVLDVIVRYCKEATSKRNQIDECIRVREYHHAAVLATEAERLELTSVHLQSVLRAYPLEKD
jgi:hypothetical protein